MPLTVLIQLPSLHMRLSINRCSANYVTACTASSYNPKTNMDNAGGCLQCPLYATSPIAAVNLSQCVCQDGFMPSLNNGIDKTAGFSCICPAGAEKRGDADGNVICGQVCAY